MAVKIPSKLDSMSPTFQKAWYKRNKMPLPPHLTGSVKQASKEVKPSERVKRLQTKSLQAYGATKGAKVGGEHGSGEMKDTIAPLTRDQHSKVQAAERAAKAAAKAAAPAKAKKPLSKAERMSAIARAVTKAKSKERFDVPTVNPDDVDHDDLRDLHQSLHVRGTYSEATDRMALIKSVAAKNKMNKPVSLTKKPETLRKKIDSHKHFAFFGDIDYANKAMNKGSNRFEEVELEEGKMKDIVTDREETARLAAQEPPFTPDKKVVRRGPGGPMSQAKWLAKQAMMKKMKELKKEEVEPVVEQDDSMEKKEMAQTQLHFIKYAAEEILEFISMGGEIEEWYQNKLSKVQSEVESLHSYIEGEKRRTGMVEEVEQVDEKAPPGAKFERMVKHIKKGYAKDGLTKQEKSIAYATAWKAYNKKNEEVEATEETLDEKYMGFKKVMAAAKEGGARDPAAVAAAIGRKKYGKEKFQAMAAAGKKANEEVDTGEADARKTTPSSKEKQKEVFAKHKERMKELAKEEVVTEAEGTVAVTPKEKALAAHHGDKTKITYGDVIKARLKSAAAKKMGK